MSTVRVHTATLSTGAASTVRVHTAALAGAVTNVSRVRVHTATLVGLHKYSRWDAVSKTWRPTTWKLLIPTPVVDPPWVFDPNIQPGPANTGVPAGTALTVNRPAGGRLTVTTAGTVIEDQDIYGQVYVQAKDVIIRRCRIRGRAATGNEALIQATSAGVVNLTVEDCTLRPDFPSYWLNGFSGANFTARRNDISRTVDGFGLYDTTRPGQPLNVTIEANWVHDLSYFSPDPNHANDNQTHNDGIQVQGGTGAIVRGNLIDSHFATDVGTNNRPRTTALSCMLFNNNVGSTGGHVIEDNWFTGGYVPINAIGTPGVNLGRMWRNRFTPDATGTPGNPPQSIQLANSTTLLDAGAGTANQNFYTDRATGILIRYSA